ncbi:outer membrane beta-barrel protein [Vibrio sp. 99-70-13A1]|uniref:outer membrane beta-barrel protein n=1 Tax=Vibrio sp. 99-70-13A1 TaxID=2607601 RepID=UPI001493A260|nr:outer membrane beta-barrel protein [Vibrio sp. 99-70-13A1]NOH96918.1 porin family protein [Vibrio sp. 99-70-13A1]
MKKTLLVLALLGASSTAMADSWIYGGAMGGQNSFGNSDETAMGIHAGTGILPFIGVEAGYWDLGSFGSVNYNGVDRKNLDASTAYLAIKPSIDFGPLHVYAKAGLHSYELKGDSFKESSEDVMYGVGAEYFIFGPLSVGASYQNFKMKHDDSGVFSLNATIHLL